MMFDVWVLITGCKWMMQVKKTELLEKLKVKKKKIIARASVASRRGQHTMCHTSLRYSSYLGILAKRKKYRFFGRTVHT